MTRRSYSGNAPATTLNGGINNTTLSIVVASATGYPSGGAGPFFIVIDRGLATEEKVLVDSTSGATFTVNASGRGSDGTGASSHVSGAIVEHVYTKTDADEANDHVNTVSRDDHTQYMKTDGTRHDLLARHAIGILPTGTTGSTVAFGNHTHAVVTATPLGTLGYAEKTATNQTGIGSVTNLTGLSVAVTVGTGRRIKVTGVAPLKQNTSAGGPVLYIFEGGSQLQTTFFPCLVNQTVQPYVQVILSPSAGAHTYNLAAAASLNTIDTSYGVAGPAFILVEDIGV